MPTPYEQIEALLSKMEATVAERFREFIRLVNSEAVTVELEKLIVSGNVTAALEIVDTYAERLADVIPVIQQTAGAAAAAELAETASEFVLAIGFDTTNPRAAALARTARLKFLTDFTSNQRIATRMAMTAGFETGLGSRAVATAFREAIGLHPIQVGWLNSYERRLRTLDPKALGMQLRGRRFDRQVRRAIERQAALSEDQIRRMVERYRWRALQYRSEVISRTESLRALSASRHEAMLQMIETTGIDPRRVVRIWHSTHDDRVRDHHATMDNQRVGVDEKFEDGLGNLLLWPGDEDAPPETTIQCRCAVTYEIKPPLQDQRAVSYQTA